VSSSDLPTPDFARAMRLIGHSDQGDRSDGVQLMVHRGYAYVGHMFSKGFTVIDVRDARNPRAVAYVPAPSDTWNIHLQTHDDLLLVIHAKVCLLLPSFRTSEHITAGQSARSSAARRAELRSGRGRPAWPSII